MIIILGFLLFVVLSLSIYIYVDHTEYRELIRLSWFNFLMYWLCDLTYFLQWIGTKKEVGSMFAGVKSVSPNIVTFILGIILCIGIPIKYYLFIKSYLKKFNKKEEIIYCASAVFAALTNPIFLIFIVAMASFNMSYQSDVFTILSKISLVYMSIGYIVILGIDRAIKYELFKKLISKK